MKRKIDPISASLKRTYADGLARLGLVGLILWLGACSSETGTTNGGSASTPVWSSAFDVSGTGALSAVWGSGPSDVFAVGGTPRQGEVYHYDGSDWTAMPVPGVPLLVWVFGFSPDDVFAVGEGGGAVHYDGVSWRTLETGTTGDLWGVWGSSRETLWVVGGDADAGEPVILQFDGDAFTSVTVPENDRNAASLFKVWGIGSKVFAVGENGLIIEYAGGVWSQVSAGAAADDDFVSLWGTSENNIVAVGGRSSARIAHYDGSQWTTELHSGTPGLNAVFMVDANEAIVGGTNGFAGSYDPLTGMLEAESSTTNLCLHGLWGDGEGSFFAVGGRFSDPYEGLALLRTLVDPSSGSGDAPPSTDECAGDEDCATGQMCSSGACVTASGNGSRDSCTFEADCVLGENCESGACLTSDGPDIQYWARVGSSYAPVTEGGELPVQLGFQGGVHTFVSVRTTGFPSAATALFSIEITLDDGTTIVSRRTLTQLFTDVGNGVNEAQGVFTRFEGAAPGDLDGRTAVISLSVTDPDDESISASLTQSVRLIEAEGS